MHPIEDNAPRRRGRFSVPGRVILVVGVVAFFVLLTSLRGIASFYTDYLWFNSLGFTSIWRGVLGAKIVLTLIFGGVFFVLMWGNLMIADRIAPSFREPGPEEELLVRYHEVVDGHSRLIRTAASALFALVAAAGVSGQWESWLLFVNSKDFGILDPQFNKDIGFYVFRLPFLSFVVSWAFAAIVIVFIITVISHYLNGGIRIQVVGRERVIPAVKVHMSALLAALALVKAADYWLARYELTVSRRGVVDGALYTDVKAQLPAINLLILISLFAVVLLVINIRRRGWVLPALAVGLWAFVAIVVGGIYPAFVQRFQVQPNETTREAPFTQLNIDATRAAYDLVPGKNITRPAFDYTDVLTADQIHANAGTVRNARLLDPVVVDPTFERVQVEREFYSFPGVLDTDRYVIDGEVTQVLLAARELNLNNLSWEREHVRLTHGYGLALAKANATTTEGRPEFLIGGLPTEVDPAISTDLTQPQIYHGEGMSGYALVNASVTEVDYVDSLTGKDVATEYAGISGVKMGSFFRKAAFALRFGQIDPLISNFVDKDTRVIYVRDVRDRVAKIAPFLRLDSDTYPVIVDGRIFYVIDAYTTTNRYPYSQRAENSRLRAGGLAGSSFNYVSNSVKAVVDSYDGTVSLYVMPVDDPIIEVWRSAFPKLFTDYAAMPQQLKEHVRYPQDLFRVQTNMWATYQISDPTAFVIGTGRWSVAQDPGRTVKAGGSAVTTVNTETGAVTTREARIDPYYTLLRLPGEDKTSYVTLRTFVPFDKNDDRRELEAFVAGETLPDGTSRLVSYEVTGSQAPGPVLVASAIAQNKEISSQLTLLNDSGSTVIFGNLLLLPIDNSILWIRPLYVAAEGTSVPTLEFVVAAVGEGEQIALGKNLKDALTQLYPGENFDELLGGNAIPTTLDPGETPSPTTPAEPGTTPGGDITPPPTMPADLVGVLDEIETQRLTARTALAADPPDYQAWARAQEELDRLLAKARSLAGAGTSAASTVDPGEVNA